VSEWREAGAQAGGGGVESRGRVHYGNARREGGWSRVAWRDRLMHANSGSSTSASGNLVVSTSHIT